MLAYNNSVTLNLKYMLYVHRIVHIDGFLKTRVMIPFNKIFFL